MTSEGREEMEMQQAADAIGALSVQMDAANAAADAGFAKMVAETAGSAVNAVRDSAIGMGEGWLESAGGLGTRVFDALHPTEQMSEEDQKRFELLAKQADGLSAPVGKTGFHLASNIPVCTANAVLRCSFGAIFGQLNVLPINRVCIGAMNAPVATITDFAPLLNIPQFAVCFNILNPSVAIATAAATAAKGGVFTLVPMPCIAGLSPTPWKVPKPQQLCGGMPVLTQDCSSSCWAIGSINIIHNGQGLMPNTFNGFMGPDWLSTIKANAELLVNAAGSIAAVAGFVTKGAKFTQLVSNSKALSFMKTYGVDILEGVGNATVSVTSFMEGNAGDGFSGMADASLSLLSAALTARKGGPKVHANNYNRAQYNVASANGNLNTKQANHVGAQMDASMARGNKGVADAKVADARIRQNAADENLANARTTQRQANSNVSDAKANQAKADKNVSDAKTAQKQADKKVSDAKANQAKADKDLGDARSAQTEANTNVNQAKEKQKIAEKNVSNAEANQKRKEADLNNAKAERDKVYSDPNSTPQQKKAADDAVANADRAKMQSDADLGTARHEKTKADNGVEWAESKKAEADNAVANAQTNKKNADNAVTNAETNKMKADADVDSAEIGKAKADMDVNNAQANKAKADQDVNKAKGQKKEADANADKAQKEADKAQRDVERADREVERTQSELNDAQRQVTEAENAADDAFEAGRQAAIEAATEKPDSGIVAGVGRSVVMKVEGDYADELAGSYFEKDWGEYIDYTSKKD